MDVLATDLADYLVRKGVSRRCQQGRMDRLISVRSRFPLGKHITSREELLPLQKNVACN